MTCTVCNNPARDAYLCKPCTRQLEQALAELPALLHNLDVTISRQDRGTGTPLYAMRADRLQRPGAHYEEGSTTLPATPWPFAWNAADLAWAAGNTATTWARHLVESRGVHLGPRLAGPVCRYGIDPTRRDRVSCGHESCRRIRGDARPDARAALAFLLANLDSIRQDEAAAQIHDEITGLHAQLVRAIDRRDPDLFAGRCTATDVRIVDTDGTLIAELAECGTDLYAHTGDDEVRCLTCGRTYPIAARREHLRELLPDEWARPQLIADALTELEEPVNASTLRTWIERDRRDHQRYPAGDPRRPARPLVLQVGIDQDGHALYRVGDVQARIKWARTQRRNRESA